MKEDINYKYALAIYFKGLLKSGRISEKSSRLALINCFLEDLDELNK